MGVAAKPLTWDDIQDWPYDPSRRVELVAGELVMPPSPAGPHQLCVSELVIEIGMHVRRKQLGRVLPGPLDVVLSPKVVLQPDVLYIAAQRIAIIGEHIAGPPDLCVEVISESNRTHDTVVKFAAYARHGVAEYWLGDLREGDVSSWRAVDGRFELIDRARAGEKLPSLVLPELHLDPRTIFPPSEQ